MLDALLDAVHAARTPGQRGRAEAMLENAACAARLNSMYDLLEAAYAESGSVDREDWRCDNWAAVCARIGAAQTLTSGMVNSLLTHAVVMREKLPEIGALFGDGLITYLLVRTICKLTALVEDPDARRVIDAALAAELLGWGAKSVDQIDRDINTIIARHDPYAVRRMQDSARTHHVDVHVDGDTAYVTATVAGTDGMAFDERADRLARTVCPRDPRTLEQRRGAAVGAMGFGWDRLPCLCESPDCEAASTPPVGGVVIHVIAGADALDGAVGGAAGGHGPDTEPPAPPPVEPDPEDGFEPPPDDDWDDEDDDEADDWDTESGCGAEESEPPAGPESTTAPEQVPPSQTRPAPVVGDLSTQRRALVGEQPPLLSKPLREYTRADLCAELNADPGEYCPARPGVILGGVLPAPVIAQLAMYATITPLVHPGEAAPEPRYRPSQRLADFIRARDLTCRFPGCTRVATRCQIDHVTPYPYGPTAASNLVCLCVEHHLLKTFWPDWSYTLRTDGTAVWTDPDGQTSTSYPGSRLLFPELCKPVAKAVITESPPPKDTAGLMMPRRTITRKQAREKRIDAERDANTEWAEQYLRDNAPPF